MSESGHSDRISRGTVNSGYPEISAYTASYAVAFIRATAKNGVFAPGARQTPKSPRSFRARTSPAEGGRLRCGFAAARRRRCRDRDQELKAEPLPCLINSAGSSTYPAQKSVRTIRATPEVALAGEVRQFVKNLPPVLTDRERIATELIRHAKVQRSARTRGDASQRARTFSLERELRRSKQAHRE
jgi:hypothetical protein